MNFIDYCIATKNYSTLKAIKDYTEVRSFADKSSKKGVGKKIAAGAGIAAALAGGAYGGKKLLDKFYVPKDKYDEVLEKGIAAQKRLDEVSKNPEEALAYQAARAAQNGQQPTDEQFQAVLNTTSDEEEQERAADEMAEQHGFSRLYSDVLNMNRRRR